MLRRTPSRVEQNLEDIKTEWKQKKIELGISTKEKQKLLTPAERIGLTNTKNNQQN